MRGKEQVILVAAGGVLRLHDVLQARDGNVHVVERENMALVPDGLEIESLHDECQVDLQVLSSCARESLSLHDAFREPPIARRVERFVTAPEIESGRLTRRPASNQV